MSTAAIAAFACFHALVAAQTLTPAPIVPPVPLTAVLKAARMFDAKAGVIVKPGIVVVVGGKIVGVGDASKAPSGAQTIDLGDATLLPGFMDAHVHLAGQSSGDWKADWIDDE